MNDYLDANRTLWNAWTQLHAESPFYDLPGFKAGKSSLRRIEQAELGDKVAGKTLLHLQCHYGQDTLSWARKGASVTGVDFSPESIALAGRLSEELAIPATFICSDIARLPDVLTGQFDIVFTSYGVLHWLSDLRRWGEVIAHFLKPGGVFYIVEDHPFMRVFHSSDPERLTVGNPYFYSEEPYEAEMAGSYASDTDELRRFYMWDHSLGEVITTLIDAGLRIEFLHEFPVAVRAKFPFLVQGDDGWWRLPPGEGEIPLLFSLQARKPN